MKFFKPVSRIVLYIIGLFALYITIVIIYATVTNFSPGNVEIIEVNGMAETNIPLPDTISFLSWNIGFCGLGAEMDFFYDNGEMVRPTDELVEKYTNGVVNYLKNDTSVDFIILQEVDENSARTNRQNEIEIIANALPQYFYSYADNYNVKFVPIPFSNPLGKVEAGQMNLSKMKPLSSKRIAFQSAYAWPKNLFMLDRCFVVSRFDVGNGKQLVLLNTHNSAYDTGGKLRKLEMPVIRDLMVEEFEMGNYVIAGGDWNQNPPDYDFSKLDKTYPAVTREELDGELFPNKWHIAYDPYTPTNREIDTPLKKGITTSTIIDYYIVSPNVQVLETKTRNLDFANSDHHPVKMKVCLLKN